MGKTAEKKEELIPKGFLYALGFLVIASLVIVFYSVLTDRPMAGLPVKSELEQEILIQLANMDAGSVSIFDDSKRNILNSKDGNSGFISVILSGLEYNRNTYLMKKILSFLMGNIRICIQVKQILLFHIVL